MIAATCYFVHSFAIYFKKARHKSTLVYLSKQYIGFVRASCGYDGS